ncbi:MAG: M43 family zinc metalloprotease [Cryomorphaceae bacterium]
MKFLFTLVISVWIVNAFSQQVDPDDGSVLLEKCHSYEMMDRLLEEHPELEESIRQSAENLENELENDLNNKLRDGDVYTIPVVFHVIHDYGDENISVAQIENAIDVLNEDFSATNPDVGSVNSNFADIVADVGIRFALARRDPEGNCTNGIVRTAHPNTYNGGENLKEVSPIWDRSRYMNIWVCKTIGSGAAGYTRYPSSVNNAVGEQIDGIVVRSDYVGAIETSTFTRSSTLSHEVGHWINLAHLWGSTNSPDEESNCDADDGVADTPNTIGWTSCVTNGESCGSLDNVENYMEYSFCAKMFTEGQKQRMINALSSSVADRSSLWQEENLEFTGVDLEPELCSAGFTSDIRTICAGESVNFTDLSYSAVEERTWIFDGGQPASSTSETPSVTYNTPGLYSVGLVATDGINSVSAVESEYIRVLDTAVTQLPFQEGFEAFDAFNESGDQLWYTNNQTGNIDWEITDLASYSGDQSARVRGRLNENGEKEYLLSQTFDLSNIEQNAILSFKYSCARRNPDSDDELRVWISRDCGETWSLRQTLDDDDLYTVSGFYANEFVPQSQSEWMETSISSIVSVFLNPTFRVRFEFTSSNGNNVYLDDINLIDANTLSVADIVNALKSELAIYPNPTNGETFIDFSSFSYSGQTDILLMDLSGRELERIYSGNLINSGDRLPVNLSRYSAGIYFLDIRTDLGRFSKKIVVNK